MTGDPASTPAGSGAYYSIRFAPENCRNDLFRIEGLIRRLASIPRECSDPAIALRKLQWWRQELEESLRGTPRHPASRDLAEIQNRRSIPPEAFDNLLRSIEHEIVDAAPRALEQFDRHCADRGGSIAALLTAVAGGDGQQIELSRALGIFSRQVEVVRNLGGDLRRGRMLLPVAPFDARGLDASQMLAGDGSEAVKPVLRELASGFRTRYTASVTAIPRGGHAPLGPAFSFSAISSALLDEIEREDFGVLHARTSLTPTRKLWIAWRHHRKIRHWR